MSGSKDYNATWTFTQIHPASQDQLRDVLDNLCLGLGVHGGEPFCEADLALA